MHTKDLVDKNYKVKFKRGTNEDGRRLLLGGGSGWYDHADIFVIAFLLLLLLLLWSLPYVFFNTSNLPLSFALLCPM